MTDTDLLPQIFHDGEIYSICSLDGLTLRRDDRDVWGCPIHGDVFVQRPEMDVDDPRRGEVTK